MLKCDLQYSNLLVLSIQPFHNWHIIGWSCLNVLLLYSNICVEIQAPPSATKNFWKTIVHQYTCEQIIMRNPHISCMPQNAYFWQYHWGKQKLKTTKQKGFKIFSSITVFIYLSNPSIHSISRLVNPGVAFSLSIHVIHCFIRKDAMTWRSKSDVNYNIFSEVKIFNIQNVLL